MSGREDDAREAARQRMLLLQAALDGELDAPALLSVTKLRMEDPAVDADYRRLSVLRDALRKLPKLEAGEDFRARLSAAVTPVEAPPAEAKPALRASVPAKSPMEWMPTAVAASFALVLGGALTFLALPARPDIAQTLVADHLRGMISGQPADVASSDRHTVKPWFATRITDAPQVVDLSAAGFLLVGGRIDVIADKPVATLVFQRAKHVISVTELPAALAPAGTSGLRRSVRGYSVLSWSSGAPGAKTTYVAVSDIAPAELDALAEAFRKALDER